MISVIGSSYGPASTTASQLTCVGRAGNTGQLANAPLDSLRAFYVDRLQTNRKTDREGTWYPVHLRTPVAVSLVLIALAGLLAFVLPRTGSQMGEFPVSGSFDAGATRGFQTAFLRFSNEIRRRYSSEFARRFGMVLSFDVYEGAPVAGADAFGVSLGATRTEESPRTITPGNRVSLGTGFVSDQ